MKIEPKQAFYNEDTGAVQPWKDIEVTDAVGNELVAEGLVTEIEGGGGGGDFSTAKVTFVIGSGLGSFSYGASVDYPSINPNTSSQVQYAETNVIGDTASPIPRQEINSTQVVNVLTYKGTAYISTYFELYPYNDYSPISVSGYTLSGAAETVEDEESPFYEAIKVTGECTITLTRE